MTPDILRRTLAETPSLELLPAASEDHVAGFEARLGITLPPAYRRFLIEVAGGILCNGGLWLLDVGARVFFYAKDGSTVEVTE